MNVVFKVYWNNPIEMVAEAGTQQLTFEVPLGAIISNPSEVIPDYPSFAGNAAKVLTVNATEDDVEWTTVSSGGGVGSVNGQTGVVVLDADDVGATTQTYVDTQDGLLQDQINLKAAATSVSQSLALKADAIAVSQSLDTKADAMATSQSLALKADLIGGLIPASQLPSYVDDVLNFPDLASFPFVGEDGKIYVAEDTNKTYRWSGSSYVEIGGGGVALGETSSTAYRGDNGKIAYDHSLSQGNPHNTTTSNISEGTKLFFTEPRVNQTVLTGLNTSTATPALATDQLLAAIGKLQAQINNIAPPTWVSAASIGTVHPSLTGMEFAKINGNLWVRGRYQSANTISNGSILFTLTDAGYRIEAPEPPSTFDLLLGQVVLITNFSGAQYLELLGMVNPNRYYFKLRNRAICSSVASPNYAVIQPTPIGKLLTP
jgi:hypothetical protein